MSGTFSDYALKDRRFLVTGGAGGAGSAIALAISRCGGKVTLSVRDVQKGEKVLTSLMGSGHGLLSGVPSGFDGLVHCAGSEMLAPLHSNTHSRTVDAMTAYTQAVQFLEMVGSRKTPLVKDGGSIVLMSSVAAVRGQVGMSLYCASKAAVEGLARAAAVELAPRRIRVNCLRAGGFASPMHTRLCNHMSTEAIDEYAKRHLIGFGRAQNIADAAIFLLSDASSWVTGTELTVDGGLSAK